MLPATGPTTTLREALPLLAKLPPDEIRLVLPAAGDPVGLPGPGPFTGAALLAGEGVIAGPFGFVPEVREPHVRLRRRLRDRAHGRSSRCRARAARRRRGSGPGRGRSRADTRAGEATAALTRLDVAQWRPELAGALPRCGARTTAPSCRPGYDPRARRLFARASVLDRVLALADEDAPGGAINSYEAQGPR